MHLGISQCGCNQIFQLSLLVLVSKKANLCLTYLWSIDLCFLSTQLQQFSSSSFAFVWQQVKEMGSEGHGFLSRQRPLRQTSCPWNNNLDEMCWLSPQAILSRRIYEFQNCYQVWEPPVSYLYGLGFTKLGGLAQ